MDLQALDPATLESLPDEALVEIFSRLTAKEIQSVCLTNPNLSRFCGDRRLRLTVLRNSYRQAPNLDILYTELVLEGRGEWDLEKLEAILDLHPGWVDQPLAYSLEGEGKIHTVAPLEAAQNVKVLQLLLDRGANPLFPAFEIFFFSVGIVFHSFEDARDEQIELTILEASLHHYSPVLHYLLLQREYRVDWSDIDLNDNTLNLDLLMYYAANFPYEELGAFLSQGKGIPDRNYFPLLTLAQNNVLSKPLKLGILHADTPIPYAVVASYYPIDVRLDGLNTADLRNNPDATPFYLRKQLDYALGPLPERIWGPMGKEALRTSLVDLTLNLNIDGVEVPTRLNYYSGVGLMSILYGKDGLPNTGTVLEREIIAVSDNPAECCLSIDFYYRLDPEVPILPYLLQYTDLNGNTHRVQYEHPDFVIGFKLGLEMRRRGLSSQVVLL